MGVLPVLGCAVERRPAARQGRAKANFARGVAAEELACQALAGAGWEVLGRRLRTQSGEVDAVAQKDGLLAFVEVKSRPSLSEAAACLGARQQARLLGAAEILLGQHPNWGPNGVRFDVMLVDGQNRVRRVPDAFRLN